MNNNLPEMVGTFFVNVAIIGLLTVLLSAFAWGVVNHPVPTAIVVIAAAALWAMIIAFTRPPNDPMI
jgi:heme A synthase